MFFYPYLLYTALIDDRGADSNEILKVLRCKNIIYTLFKLNLKKSKGLRRLQAPNLSNAAIQQSVALLCVLKIQLSIGSNGHSTVYGCGIAVFLKDPAKYWQQRPLNCL